MKIVIVGSGLAGVTVAETLAKSARHEVTLATAETHGYYARPRLSHGLALSDETASRLVLKRFDGMAPGVRVLAGTQVERVERDLQQIALATGERLGYEVLILATGSAARIPPSLEAQRARIFTLNSLDDLLALRRRRAENAGSRIRWAVIGGGLIGCEAASDLNRAGDAVTIFHRAARLLDRQLTLRQSQALQEHFAARGVEVRCGEDLRELPVAFDGVLVAVGFAPRVGLAKEAGLATARGIVVNDYLRTNDPRIYAVGDVAEVVSRLYPFVTPIRSQALWLAEHLEGRTGAPWTAPAFSPVIKIHGFKLEPEVSSAAT
jgi:NAD(P)H-nitrite reductase large subunit